MKLLISTLILLFSFSAHAQIPSGLTAQHLLKITNSKDKKVGTLSILIDQNNRVAGLYSQGGDNPDKAHFLKDFETNRGVALVERDTSVGHMVLIALRGRISRETQEGKGMAIYISNGLWGSKEFCDFEIRKNPEGKWYIKNVYTKKPVSRIHVLASSFGITGLQGLCPVDGK
jgi:hypothetical protein